MIIRTPVISNRGGNAGAGGFSCRPFTTSIKKLLSRSNAIQNVIEVWAFRPKNMRMQKMLLIAESPI
jgi:hypothetical protein